MHKWSDYYRIVRVQTVDRDMSATAWMLDDYWTYELHDIYGNVIGSYKDYQYAKKQAKYKFKKMQAKLEKILLV